ncbi:hypothetical protein [Glutamicibacter sp. X7]
MDFDDAPVARKGRTARAVWTMLCVAGIAVAGYFLALWLAPDVNASGQCSGIGFGCTLTPRDALLFFGFLLALPVLIGLIIFGGATAALLLRRTRMHPVLIGLISSIGALLLSLVLGFVLLFAAY